MSLYVNLDGLSVRIWQNKNLWRHLSEEATLLTWIRAASFRISGGTLAVLTEHTFWFYQSLKKYIGHDRFFSNPFQFIIHQSSYHRRYRPTVRNNDNVEIKPRIHLQKQIHNVWRNDLDTSLDGMWRSIR